VYDPFLSDVVGSDPRLEPFPPYVAFPPCLAIEPRSHLGFDLFLIDRKPWSHIWREHTRSSAGFTIITSGFEFSVHTAGHSPNSANRKHQITCHPWRTSPPLRPSLSFRYTQAAYFFPTRHLRQAGARLHRLLNDPAFVVADCASCAAKRSTDVGAHSQASSRLFDLKGEAKIPRTKHSSPIIPSA
jgi:hypothetical protein